MNVKGIQIGLIIILLSTLISCEKENVDYAASIEGKYEISEQKLIDYYKDGYFARRFPDAKYKGFEHALDELVIRKLKQVDFVNRGLHNDEDLISGIQRIINEELIVLYFDTKYLGQYITDEVIEDYYEGLGRKVNYQQIVLNKNAAVNLEDLKQKALNIKEEAEETGNFTQLVREYSQDGRSLQNDGRMPAMTWRSGTSSPQNQVIFRMPEGSVQVVETPRSILIVKVNHVEEAELRPLEEIKPAIKERLREVYSPRAFDDYDRDKAKLIDESSYEWNTEGLNQLVEWSRIDGFYRQEKYKQIIRDHLNNGENFEILSYENGTVDLQKYLYLLENILLIETSANATKGDFQEFIDEALRSELIVENARELGLDQNILSLETKSPVILDEFVRLYNEKFMRSRIPEATEENYQKFYKLTKDTLFYQPDKVNLRVKVFDSEEEAQEMMNEINNGKEFEDIFRAWSVKSYFINKEGNIESYLSNEPNYLGDEGFQLSEGETAGPVSFTGNDETKYAIIKANNVEEEKILSLDEVHPTRLRRMFRNYYFNKYSEEVVNNLKDKYDVQINEQLLAKLSGTNQE